MRDRQQTWPPPWEGGGDTGLLVTGAARTTGAGAKKFPPPEWPTKAQVDYAQAIIVLALLILALPWVVSTLLTRPGVLFSGLLGRRVLPL